MARSFYRVWFWRGVRIAPVVGVIAAGWYSWTVMDRFQKERVDNVKLSVTYDCVANLSPEVIKQYTNPYGNINVKDLCLTGTDFFVSPDEVARARAGTLKLGTYWEPFDGQGTVITGTIWAVLTILATSVLLGITFVGRWVWGRSATG
ncbi:hypothetical protein MesoLj113a_45720 [Mesorhizobium sp. 113-1-2]|uniref:hypothetical protein n=1 Tax=Mesorhizobium sp. 113-1-2 TaxID=2744515 RepID=UPI0019268426|nr:hypothetical protein [Mesorhizobium sp. 113-1-2]BCG73414.1 hypothetical protein MesoLj113a_45720 [Mesorhizobium sp. 113-1-2]